METETNKSKMAGKPLEKFFGFTFFQIVVSFAVIAVYRHSFLLSGRMIILHMMAILLIYCILTLGSVFILSLPSAKNNRATPYLLAVFWSCAGIFLYTVYLLAFLGKQNINQGFTFALVFGYVKDFGVFIQSLSISYFLIFFFLLFIPACIVGWHILFSNIIFNGLSSLQPFLFARYLSPFITMVLSLFLFGAGFFTGTLYPKIFLSMYLKEEPLVHAIMEVPLQANMYLPRNLENPAIRTQYPHNIDFEKLNVVILVVDALRADHLGLFGYQRNTSPFIDSLFHEGTLRKADLSFANASGSLPGILTILRGRYWSEMGTNDFALHDLLQDQGYVINFLISGNHKAFYGLKDLYGKSIDFYFDGGDTQEYVVNDDRLIFEAFKKIPLAGEKPAFFYIHLNSVHAAGIRLPENRAFTPWQHHRTIHECYINNYDNGIIQADNYIKRIFQLLKDEGYLEKSIVIITADHGESLGERGLLGHSHHLYTDELLIPVLIYDPDQTVVYQGLTFATQVDIAPTLVDRLGLPIPDSWSGNSLLKPENHACSFHYMHDWSAVIHYENTHIYKYLFNCKTEQEEVYDLKTDLYETHNMINEINAGYLQQLRDMTP